MFPDFSMIAKILDYFNTDAFKKQVQDSLKKVDSFDYRLIRIETKIDLLLAEAGLNVLKINDDINKVYIANQNTVQLEVDTPLAIKDAGHA